jgi:hypothetical protein
LVKRKKVVMHTLHRRLYRLLVRLHPAAVRNEFACEMALDFEDSVHAYGLACLFLDATGSLARRWSARILFGASNPISVARPSLLAGNYVIVHDKTFTPLELGRGLLASTAMLALCCFVLSVSPGHTLDLPIVYASSSAPATDRNPNPGTRLPTGESSSSGFKVSQSAVAAFAQIGTASTPLPSNVSAPTPTLSCALAGFAQTQPKPELLLFHPSDPLPSYEVATIKPLESQYRQQYGQAPARRFSQPPEHPPLHHERLRRHLPSKIGSSKRRSPIAPAEFGSILPIT